MNSGRGWHRAKSLMEIDLELTRASIRHHVNQRRLANMLLVLECIASYVKETRLSLSPAQQVLVLVGRVMLLCLL